MTLRRFAACTLVLVLAPPCLAQGPLAPGGLKQLRAPLDGPPYALRTDAFRRLLFEFKLQPLHDFADLHTNPSQSLLLVLGDPSCLSKRHFPQGVRAFVEQGGAVLIATDKKTEGEAGELLDQLAGVAVTGETLVCPLDNPEDRYDSSPFCPFVQPLAASTTLQGSTNALGMLAALFGAGERPALFRNPHPELKDLRVAANAPSRLNVRGLWLRSGIHRLAELPRDCQVEGTPYLLQLGSAQRRQAAPPRKTPSEKPLFAAGGTVGKGRVLVLADHSVFINRMILPRDNGNLEFAANCLHWLRGGVSTPAEALHALSKPQGLQQLTGQRNQVLFWDDGKPRTDFEVPLTTAPRKPALATEPVIVAAVDKTIANLEDSDFFNRSLLDAMDDLPGGRRRVVRYAVYLLTLAAFLFLGYRFFWRIRHRPEPAIPLLAEAVGRHEPRQSLLEQRRRALLRSGNVWEMVHRLARECFESAGVPLVGATPPRDVRMQASWRQRRRLLRLWRLARGDAPVRIRPAALPRWLRELEELKTALAEGAIRLT